MDDVLAGAPLPQDFLKLPKNEASDLLILMFSKLFLECLTNPEHGLDCYLSIRIRHGALSGQLRGPLEEEKIITQRAGATQLYKRNDYWLDKFNYLDGGSVEQLNALLATFSHDYDEVIDTFVSERVQVQSDQNSKR
jgi:hypothetical protein